MGQFLESALSSEWIVKQSTTKHMHSFLSLLHVSKECIGFEDWPCQSILIEKKTLNMFTGRVEEV